MIRFFDAYAIQSTLGNLSRPDPWPDFEPRQANGRYSDEHRAIMECGHEYQHNAYISGTLAALYRIRPDVPQIGKRTAFLGVIPEVRRVCPSNLSAGI